jgi:hypothetical protein
MFSIKFRDLLSTVQSNPKELGYFADSWIVLEFLNKEIGKPQRVEILECKLMQELTEGCVKV